MECDDLIAECVKVEKECNSNFDDCNNLFDKGMVFAAHQYNAGEFDIQHPINAGRVVVSDYYPEYWVPVSVT